MAADHPHKYKAAIIGLGQVGSLFDDDPKRKGIWTHAGAYRAVERVELVAGADISEERRRRFAQRWGVGRVYSSYQEMLRQESLDLVSIASPTEMHYQMAMEAAQAGVKGIFLEKPMASQVWQAREILGLCQKKGVVLAVNHTRRWDDNYIVPSAMLNEGIIGELRAVVAYYSSMVYNIGTHLFDVMRLYGGDVEAVRGEFVSEGETSDPTISGALSFRRGARGFIVPQGKRENLLFELDLIGSKGRIRAVDNGAAVELYQFRESKNYSGYLELERAPLPQSHRTAEGKDRFVAAIEDIIRCVEEGGSPACSGYDGLAALEIAEALVRSARMGGARVSLPL